MAFSKPLPHKLSGLTTREAITDSVYRMLYGIDSNDRSSFASGWTTTTEPSFVMGEEYKGLDTINQAVMDRVGHLDTMHYITNLRIDVRDGKDTATATAYAQNQHFGPGKGTKDDAIHLLAGGKYELEFVNEGGDNGWRVKKWVFNIVWKQGDFAVFNEK